MWLGVLSLPTPPLVFCFLPTTGEQFSPSSSGPSTSALLAAGAVCSAPVMRKATEALVLLSSPAPNEMLGGWKAQVLTTRDKLPRAATPHNRPWSAPMLSPSLLRLLLQPWGHCSLWGAYLREPGGLSSHLQLCSNVSLFRELSQPPNLTLHQLPFIFPPALSNF